MPELPEVETTRRGLAAVLVGQRIERAVARRPDLRFPLPERFAERLAGRTVRGIGRRAKYLLFDLDDDQVMIAHLGMSGSFTVVAPDARGEPESPHDHVILLTGDGDEVRFHDPRRFGYMALAGRLELDDHPLLRGLGPEPLGPAFTPARLMASLAGRRGPIKTALLDQRVVAGLGNIYVCEALYRAGISPRRRAGGIGGARAERLVPAIHGVLEDAIAAGGSSLRDFKHADGRLGYFQTRFAVYDREGQRCPGCGDGACAIRRIVQSGRSTFYCPRRQR